MPAVLTMQSGIRHRRRTPSIDSASHHKRILQPGTTPTCSLGSDPKPPAGTILYDRAWLLRGIRLSVASASHVRGGSGMGSRLRSRQG